MSALPELCQKVMNAYESLDFGLGRHVVSPYYMNADKRKRAASAVESGKGSPEEIVEELKLRALIKKIDLAKLSREEIRQLMTDERIGIDCSGLVSHILDPWVKETSHSALGRSLLRTQRSLKRKLLLRFRPFQNIDVTLLTSPENAQSVMLTDVKPGDLIRTRGGKHVLLIDEVEKDMENLISFSFIHSSDRFGNASGVQRGRVVILKPEASLYEQHWQESLPDQKPAYEGWLEEREENGILRLNAINEKSQIQSSKFK